MMNKFVKAGLASIFAISMVGCSDASVKLSDSSTALIKVGGTSVTKGDVYSIMVDMSGADTVINDATNTIASAEVEITDEIQEQAESTLSTYQTLYGDSFATYLESAGMTEDEYLNTYLIPSLLASELTTKYVEQNWDSLIATYKPRMATVLEFTSTDDRDAALSELNAGEEDAATVAENNNSSSTGESELFTSQSTSLDSMVRAVLSSLTPEDGWTNAETTSGSTFYLVRVDDDDPENFRDDVVETLTSMSAIESDANTYFFKKYGFHIYDITIYNQVSASYSDYLVQDLPEDEETESTDSE